MDPSLLFHGARAWEGQYPDAIQPASSTLAIYRTRWPDRHRSRSKYLAGDVHQVGIVCQFSHRWNAHCVSRACPCMPDRRIGNVMKQLIEFAALNHIVDYHESRVFEFFCPHGVVVVLSLN